MAEVGANAATQKIAEDWQEAYRLANKKTAPCVAVHHTYIQINGSWYPADEVRHRTATLRQAARRQAASEEGA